MSQEFCKYGACERPVKALGMCRTHYRRSRTGSPMDAPIKKRTSTWAEALAERTEWQGECLVWTGAADNTGHGAIYQGEICMPAHRAAWIVAGLPLEPEQVIDHKCHNPPCVNVAHLRAVTQRENMENRAGANKNNVTGYRGVSWHSASKSYVVQVTSRGKLHYKYGFKTPEEANIVAIAMRKELYGEVTV